MVFQTLLIKLKIGQHEPQQQECSRRVHSSCTTSHKTVQVLDKTRFLADHLLNAMTVYTNVIK